MSQHRSVHRPRLASKSALALVLFGAAWCSTTACESSVISVGAWEPIQLSGGQGGVSGGGNGAVAGNGATAGSAAAAAGEAGETSAGGAEPTGPGLYLEAESAEFSSDPAVPDSGWAIIDDAAASNGKYILPPVSLTPGDMTQGTALARYSFNLDHDGDYLIWGRIWTADISSNRFWFQVDGGAWTLWRIAVGTIWYWHAFHDNTMYDSPMHFRLTAGAHELVIANSVPNARLDKLYITSFGDKPPGNTTTCHPPHSVDLGGPQPCHLSCGVRAMPNKPTTCNCAGRPDSETMEAYDCTGGKCCFVQ